jgi:hypothetical protein
MQRSEYIGGYDENGKWWETFSAHELLEYSMYAQNSEKC